MQESDQTTTPEIAAEQSQVATATISTTTPIAIDWLAIGTALLIAAIFAVIARISPQPPASLMPAAALSASGCGLLVTAIRKIRTFKRPGLLEAGISGFGLGLFQFLAAITYPGVFRILSIDPAQKNQFLATWGLVIIFTVIFSLAGAAIGHLAFAPFVPQISKARATRATQKTETELEEDQEETAASETSADPEEATPAPTSVAAKTPTIPLIVMAVFLLGLAPTVVAYVFSAAYDYTMQLFQLAPGPYPTLRILSTLLPWQIPFSVNFTGRGEGLISVLLWRVPLFLGNPYHFDFQAIEAVVFNGLALALLLSLSQGKRVRELSQETYTRINFVTYLLLEALLGLVIVVPANIWIQRGLQGLLQLGDIVVPIRTLQLLDTTSFILNFITAPVICLLIGLIVWTQRKRAFIAS